MLTTNINLAQLTALLKKRMKMHGRYTIWRVTSILTAGFLGAATILTVYFIYSNIYNTLSNSNAILILSSNVPNDIIDLQTYEKAKEAIANKNQVPVVPNNLRNIFSYGQGSTRSASPSSTKP